MSQSHETEVGSGAVGSAAQPAGVRALLAHVQSIPAPKRVSPIAGLPPLAFDVLTGGREDRWIARASADLDRAFPGWVELAADVIVEAAHSGLAPQLQALCALVARRPISRPERLLTALASRPPDSRLWLLVALSGTDTAALRESWLQALREWVALESTAADASAWFAFLRACLGGWLNWRDFRDALVEGRVLSAAGTGSCRPALERLGLWQQPAFGKWYRQVVYDISHQPDARLSLSVGGWIRDFPGQEYLTAALDELERKPDSWWPLHVLRWLSIPAEESPHIQEQLRSRSPLALCLLCLVRQDMCDHVAAAIGIRHHAAAVGWLRSAGPSTPLDLEWVARALGPWTDEIGESFMLAAGAVCSVEPPGDFVGPENDVLRRREFVRQHLVPDFDHLMDNMFYLHALRRSYFPLILEQARRGTPAAIRALALWPEQAEEAAPILFGLARSGKRAVRDLAGWALQVLRERSGASDLAHLERRVDLASAWSDAGLEGRTARTWWDVGGYRVRLSVSGGQVNLVAYSQARRLASLPAAVRKDPQYDDIRRARAELARNYRYFRRRFEQMMTEGGAPLAGREFAMLMANPVVRSLVSRLVLWVDGAPFLWSLDDPLADYSPPRELAGAGAISIAHAVDLTQARALSLWQQKVIEERIAQPFKQVFREVYLPGEEERASFACVRFAGQPLVARRAFALLRRRGYAPREGDAVKEWPAHQARAHIEWAGPDEDAGKQLGVSDAAPVTSRAVWFEDDQGREMPLGSAPPVVFSETLRDADLLVSLAAAGELGFSSEETRRLRATLVRYLARALGLTTIYVSEDDAHVIVDGKRAMYRVHLGSGSVLLEKSRRHLDLGSLRGESLEALVSESMDTFTARILGTIGALSHDDQISDPAFLGQLG